MGTVLSKIDTVLVKLEDVEKVKMRDRKKLDAILSEVAMMRRSMEKGCSLVQNRCIILTVGLNVGIF